ncbi:unnamed protein product [Soboliphyme baturini]|uniref:PH domain-containing protein n=1 Tax=Soboliphyme baturini TaxID=241478 RepID=A0A183IE36_9BILA|nr:unnamed protein product [Soboliphyme baturini]
MHPYGYANARYVASLISGVGIFCFGTGLSVYHGIQGLLFPQDLEFSLGVFLFLGVSFITEGVLQGEDPSLSVVFLEDMAALLGVGVAALCLLLSKQFGSVVPDAVGSLVIGGLLGGVASVVIYANSMHLVGRSIPQKDLLEIIRGLEDDVMIKSIQDIKATKLGSHRVRFKAEIDVDGRNITRSYIEQLDLLKLLQEMKNFKITEEVESFLLNHGELIIDRLGAEIDRIEQELIPFLTQADSKGIINLGNVEQQTSRMFLKKWKRRYAVIQDNFLALYDKEPYNYQVVKRKAVLINLKCIKTMDWNLPRKRPQWTKITLNLQKGTLKFRFDTEPDANRWWDVIMKESMKARYGEAFVVRCAENIHSSEVYPRKEASMATDDYSEITDTFSEMDEMREGLAMRKFSDECKAYLNDDERDQRKQEPLVPANEHQNGTFRSTTKVQDAVLQRCGYTDAGKDSLEDSKAEFATNGEQDYLLKSLTLSDTNDNKSMTTSASSDFVATGSESCDCESSLKKNANLVQLQCDKICGINRLIWSSWSDVLGPELRYVWEVVPSDWPPSYPLNEFGGCGGAVVKPEQSDASFPLPPNENNNSKDNELDVFPLQLLQPDAPTPEDVADTSSENKQSVSVDPNFARRQNLRRSVSQSNNESQISEDRHSLKSNSSSSFTAFDTQDDQYIAYHVLSSEIFRHSLSDSMELKVLRLPDRSLVTGAYMFSVKSGNKGCIHSIALVMSETRLDWFLKLQPLFRLFFSDMVARLKAVIFTATFEEMLVEMTSSFSYILTVCGDLEHLSFNSRPFDISDTFFAEPGLAENVFLRHCVAANFQCKGHTAVIGSSPREINKMLQTLAFVTPEDEWMLCKFASASASFENNQERPDSDYCPYLKLQGCLKMDSISSGGAARAGYVRQFLRHLVLRALALETYVGEMTNYGLERSKLNLRTVRKALNLNAKGDFLVILGLADKIRPKLAEFLLEQSS